MERFYEREKGVTLHYVSECALTDNLRSNVPRLLIENAIFLNRGRVRRCYIK